MESRMITIKRLMIIRRVVLLVVCVYPVLANAASREYVRDYSYQADEFDTKYTSRIRAIDGVKQSLVEELGTYVQSVVNIKKDSSGNKTISHDVVTLAAGVISTEILKESWNRIEYYVKASMTADKNEVLRSIEALRNDYNLEEALRDSIHELEQARSLIRDLHDQMKTQKNSRVLATLSNQYVDAARDLEVEYQYQRALREIIDGNFDEAFELLKVLADKNYSRAQSKLGHMYERGMGVDTDYKKAAEWYLKSIKNGNATAYARLGFIYERGLGVKQNFDRAAELYRHSAESGSPHGQSRLGRLYLTGHGVEKDTAKALALFRESVSEYTHGRGYTMLGYMYEKGIEVEQDYKQAAGWYDKAIRRGNPYGMARMAWLYVKGKGVDRDYDKAWSLSEHAAKYNNPFGLSVLGYLYEHGDAVFRDYERALELYHQGAEQNSRFAMFRLGNMYQRGKGVSDDKNEAIKWYRRAADLGHEKSAQRLQELAGS
jgi:TPR repeat protein